MYARANLLQGDRSKIDEGVRYVRDTVAPLVSSLPGYRGLTMSVDRNTGRGAIVSFWESLTALRDSESRVRDARRQAQEIMSGTVEVQILEVAEVHIRETPKPGCHNRVSRLDVLPRDLDGAIEAFRTSTEPALDAIPGFCAALLNVDRDSGRIVAVTVWKDHAALVASRDRGTSLRQEIAAKASGKITAVEEYEIVFAEMQP